MGMVSTFKLVPEQLFMDNTKELEKWIKREQIAPLTRFGLIVRRAARRSIKTQAPTKGLLERAKSDDPKKKQRALKAIAKRRAKVSSAGSPPYSHVARDSKESIRNILYAYDTGSETMVAGPVKFNAKGRDVPAKLEGGGITKVYRVQQAGVWRIVGKRTYDRWRGRKQAIITKVDPRPTMGPALAANKAHLPDQFKARGA